MLYASTATGYREDGYELRPARCCCSTPWVCSTFRRGPQLATSRDDGGGSQCTGLNVRHPVSNAIQERASKHVPRPQRVNRLSRHGRNPMKHATIVNQSPVGTAGHGELTRYFLQVQHGGIQRIDLRQALGLIFVGKQQIHFATDQFLNRPAEIVDDVWIGQATGQSACRTDVPFPGPP